MRRILFICCALIFVPYTTIWAKDEAISIGLNYPATGPYRTQGIQQKRGAQLAIDEINDNGGILGHRIRLIEWDSQSSTEVTGRNLNHMIDRDKVKMVFGGSSSAVAIAAGEICQQKDIIFFATLAYTDEITGIDAKKNTFRECSSTSMAVTALAEHLKARVPATTNKYFYITADYIWGHSTEQALREQLGATDKAIHQGVLTPFPGEYNDFWDAMQAAKAAKPDVLVIVLFGREMVMALKLALSLGITNISQMIVVPSITNNIAADVGPEAMKDVISTTPWLWEVPYKYNYERGKNFVDKFLKRYGNYPSTAAASAYVIPYEYKAAVERAGSFATSSVVSALEGHEYQILKNKQLWRDFDHQSVQSIYIVRGKFTEKSIVDNRGQKYFEIVSTVPGANLVPTRAEWNATRKAAGKATELK